MTTNEEEFGEDYASLVGRLVPENDRLDEEQQKRLMQIRNDLIFFASELAKRRTAMYENNDPYAYLFIEDMILQQFFIMVFHNRHKAYYDSLKELFKEEEERRKRGLK
jgi:hypothetical protein